MEDGEGVTALHENSFSFPTPLKTYMTFEM